MNSVSHTHLQELYAAATEGPINEEPSCRESVGVYVSGATLIPKGLTDESLGHAKLAVTVLLFQEQARFSIKQHNNFQC